MPDFSLVELVDADHSTLLALDEDDVVSSIVKHLTMERALLHPAIEKYLPGGTRTVEKLRQVDRALERSLETFEAEQGEASNLAVAKWLLAHIEELREPLAMLVEAVPPETLQELADQVPLVLAEAPSRPHEHLPDHGPLREATTELAAEADEIRDRL